eukprot:Blabericola_migrator_1__5205@NODE_267_length_10594_cov_56_602451_g223_i0_p5_GENE_NODE_267_length_10594_cov_56_602451_g223_i0NODE_267_length_10594_cov_56_602451_g223_i0_p5_ORF_typecomplete_len259_score37_65tRNA_m1G_MT/PF01746_21/1_9e10_NODE_267_length_10594_cov_56_602451_g223_i0932210098
MEGYLEKCEALIRLPVELICPSVSDKPNVDVTALTGSLYEGRQLTRKQKEAWQQGVTRPIIIIDVDFSHLHNDKSVASVGKQLGFSYHHSLECEQPCFLVICGATCRRLHERLVKIGALTWKCYITTVTLDTIIRQHAAFLNKSKPDAPLFDDAPEWLESRLMSSEFLYLSADGDAVLEGSTADAYMLLKPLETICVIGGLIDRNRYKGYCLNKAKALGIPAVKLPIDEILERYHEDAEFVGTKVMTIDQSKQLRLRH